MASDRHVCVRQPAADGTETLMIVDIQKGDARPLPIKVPNSSTLVHPTQTIVGIQAGNIIQLADYQSS